MLETENYQEFSELYVSLLEKTIHTGHAKLHRGFKQIDENLSKFQEDSQNIRQMLEQM